MYYLLHFKYIEMKTLKWAVKKCELLNSREKIMISYIVLSANVWHKMNSVMTSRGEFLLVHSYLPSFTLDIVR